MRRSSPLAIFSLLVAAGCAPGPETVHVDEARILASEKIVAPPDVPLPSPPLPQPAVTVTQPGLPPGYLVDPSRTSASDVTATIERQQREARRTLERRLRAVYADQVHQFELALQREMGDNRPLAYGEANKKIRARFVRYADDRVPLVSRLYDIVSFPDPNPDNGPPKTKLGAVSQRLFDEAAQIRKKLAVIEADYQREKAEILRTAEDQLSAEEAKAVTRVRELADRLERQATVEANEQVRISVRDLGLELTDPLPLALPATPSRSISIPAEEPLTPAPKVPSNRIPDSAADRRLRMQRELRIWLGIHRYRLSDRGRDATTEFQKWREIYRAGL